MPSSEPSSDESRARASRHVRIEQIVEHLATLSVDSFGASDITAAVDLLVDIKIERALYMRAAGAEQNRGPKMPQDHHLQELEEQCEAARRNLRRLLSEPCVVA